MLPLEGNSLQSERFRAQIEATEPLKKQLWQQTVKAKITNQSAVLNHWKINNNLLNNLARTVKSGDPGGYYDQSLPAFRCKVYHPKGVFVADVS